ncbi:hypothetical protein BD626DRAFT_240296 [Schizophyllum amplum]|uniref:Uncharacterized protein n=1 Tax=Schizophyllum amplum TaxID=97359 RepID=A0A550CJU5_9AGAR|nr:hypothetical protein BD626DRAFT_240296 [Auriculariopsis ampla]
MDAYATGASTFSPSPSATAMSPHPSSSKMHNQALIIALSIAAVTLLVISLAALIFCRRRHRRYQRHRTDRFRHVEQYAGGLKHPHLTEDLGRTSSTPAYLRVYPSLPSIFSTGNSSDELTSDFSYFDRFLSDVASTARTGPPSSTWTGSGPSSSTRTGSGPPSSRLSSRARSALGRSVTILTGSSGSRRSGQKPHAIGDRDDGKGTRDGQHAKRRDHRPRGQSATGRPVDGAEKEKDHLKVEMNGTAERLADESPMREEAVR